MWKGAPNHVQACIMHARLHVDVGHGKGEPERQTQWKGAPNHVHACIMLDDMLMWDMVKGRPNVRHVERSPKSCIMLDY